MAHLTRDRQFESISLQQRVHELPVPQRGIGHDLSQMGVICRAELVFDDDHSSSDVTGENVSGMDGHSLECEANRGARQMRVAASIDIHLFLRSLRRLLHRITIESVPLSS